MDPSTANVLSELRDIHAAGNPGWWPPAPGWWVLALLLGISLVWVCRFAWRRWQVSRRRRRLLDALARINRDIDPATDPHEYLARLNRLFRVVALRAFPGTPCARLQGREWVIFVRSCLPASLASDSLEALATGPYEPAPAFDASKLRVLAQTWVQKHG